MIRGNITIIVIIIYYHYYYNYCYCHSSLMSLLATSNKHELSRCVSKIGARLLVSVNWIDWFLRKQSYKLQSFRLQVIRRARNFWPVPCIYQSQLYVEYSAGKAVRSNRAVTLLQYGGYTILPTWRFQLRCIVICWRNRGNHTLQHEHRPALSRRDKLHM